MSKGWLAAILVYVIFYSYGVGFYSGRVDAKADCIIEKLEYLTDSELQGGNG